MTNDMTIYGITPTSPSADQRASQPRTETPEEAARQFEELLVRQLVGVMTEGLFDNGLAGEDGPGWMQGHRDTQRDVMEDVLAKHLVDSGAFRISDLLVRQWKRTAPDPNASSMPLDEPRPTHKTEPER